MRLVIGVVVALAACGGKKETKASGEPAGDAAAATAVAARDGGSAAARRLPIVQHDQVDALLARWLEAQNRGDFAAYAAMYVDEFRGIRRSGKQTRRLDREGWLADRKKMFRKPMLVAARDVEVVLSPGKAIVRFIQEWSSGTYHDVGPKLIELGARGAELRIVREEMLRSQIAPGRLAAAGPPPVLPVYQDMIVLAAAADSWLSSEHLTLRDNLPKRDPSCDDDPPDSDTEPTRYVACVENELARADGRWVATSEVDSEALPAELAAWAGREVRLGGVGAGCTARVERLEIRAEFETTYARVTEYGTDHDAIADEVMASGRPALVGLVSGGCPAIWARPADGPAATALSLGPASPALTAAIGQRLRSDDIHQYPAYLTVSVIPGPEGTQLAVVEADGAPCNIEAGLHVIYRVAGDQIRGDALLHDEDAGRLRAAVDVDGDGWPELVFDDGIAVRDRDGYLRTRMVNYPDEIDFCSGE